MEKKLVLALASALALWSASVGAAPASDCTTAEAEAAADAQSAGGGRQLLGQGVALFDAKRYALAANALKSALAAGLRDRHEQALAHKYLAFYYCLHQEYTQCEAEFEAAFAARASFTLDGYETQSTPWRESYLKVQTRRAQRCANVTTAAAPPRQTVAAGSDAKATITPLPSPALPAERTLPRIASDPAPTMIGFRLNSSAIVSITPAMPAPADRPASAVERVAGNGGESGATLRVRVFPWAFVQLDGKRVGVTPPIGQLSLSAGTHTVEFSNGSFDRVRRVVTVKSGDVVTISHDFDAR